MATNREYWARRAEQVLLEAERNTAQYLNALNAVYRRAADDIDERIRRIFRTYQRGFTMEEARAWLVEEIPRSQYEALKELLASMTDDRLREQTLMRLNAPAYRYRITRLQYIRQSIMTELSRAADTEKRISTECYTVTLQNAYARTMYEIQKGAGVGFSFTQLPQSTINRLLSAQWYGRNYAASVWRNRGLVAKAAGDVVKEGVLSGQSIREMSKSLMERTYTASMANATRLVRTEVNYFCNQGALESYREAGIEEYEFLATLDLRTSQVCREHDGRRYRVDVAAVGENCPPLHPYCRSTTVAVIDLPSLDRMDRRAARNSNGKTVNIENIGYDQWRNTYAKATLPKSRRERPTVLQETAESELFKGVLPKGAELSKVRLFAGRGVSHKIRVAEHLAKNYGGEAWKWQKKGAILESKYYRYDVHWFEYDGRQYELAVKGVKQREA